MSLKSKIKPLKGTKILTLLFGKYYFNEPKISFLIRYAKKLDHRIYTCLPTRVNKKVEYTLKNGGLSLKKTIF